MRSLIPLTARAGVRALSLAAALTAGARAADVPIVVVELFTSQGCAGCRPAELMAADFARRPGLLLLTWPVGYWDYLGWRDTLAQPAFAERQRGYAAARGERQIGTPQSVVNGAAVSVGAERAQIERMIRDASGSAAVPMIAAEQGDRIVIDVGAGPDPGARGEIWLVPVLRSRTVTVEAGENAGQRTYLNAARGLHRVGAWTGRPARFDLPRSVARMREADSYVILLQAMPGGRPGRIYGAARGPGP